MTQLDMNPSAKLSADQTHSKIPPLISILGPTATGKTALGVALAKAFKGEIISADSRQVYRGMDIGTGKDLNEYEDAPYHLIDIAEPGEEYNLFEFVKDFNLAFEDITSRGKIAFMVGGTGMYLDAVLNRYSMTQQQHQHKLDALSDEELKRKLLDLRPEQHNTTDLLDRARLINALNIAISEEANAPIIRPAPFRPLTLGVQFPREITRERITKRLKTRLQEGMIQEVQQLHDQGVSWEQLDFYGLEYRYIAQHLQGKLNFNDMFQKLNSAIHQFAKQQEKWFRNIAKKGHDIIWLDMERDTKQQAIQVIQQYLSH